MSYKIQVGIIEFRNGVITVESMIVLPAMSVQPLLC